MYAWSWLVEPLVPSHFPGTIEEYVRVFNVCIAEINAAGILISIALILSEQ